MRKFLLCLVSITLLISLLPAASLALEAEAAAGALLDYAWLIAQVESGAETITLPNSIVCDAEQPLKTPDKVTIDGKGCTLTGLAVEGGTIILKDTLLVGVQGLGEEDGGAALTLAGDKTIAVLSGLTRATGGAGGLEGESGGDGVWMQGSGQGLLLSSNAVVSGGVGRLYGGMGIRSGGCGNSILMAGASSAVGKEGIALGGSGIFAPACTSVKLTDQASLFGGGSSYDGGHGIHSFVCEACDSLAQVSISDTAMLSGGVGETGGNGVAMARTAPAKEGDLLIGGTSLLFGGSGGTGGYAIDAENAGILYSGTPDLNGGSYYITQAPIQNLTGCVEMGDTAGVVLDEGTKVDRYPATDVSRIIETALNQQNPRYTPEIITNGLNTRELSTKLGGVTVEKGRVMMGNVNSGGLKIYMYNGTVESRLEFTQHLMSDGADGIRFVIIGTPSQEALTVDSTLAALRKLQSLGVTQVAYTTVDPVYIERVIDLGALLSAVEAYDGETEVARVQLGTLDDCVIFILDDKAGTKVYQEELMREILRPLEAAPAEETTAE